MAEQFDNPFQLEKPATPEVSIEAPAENAVETSPAPAAPTPVQPVAATAAPKPSAPAMSTDAVQKEIEEVLSENIAAIYKQLPTNRKQQFKEKGELVAQQISAMIRSGMMQVKKILHLIQDWLKLIPGVNVFFLEQEAKIKTDKIKHIFERTVARSV